MQKQIHLFPNIINVRYFKMNTSKRIKIRHKILSDAKEDYAWQTDPELAKLDAATTLDMAYPQYLS